MKKQELLLLIKEGEGLKIEFKEKYNSKIVQDIVAFANTIGGKILIGVKDNGTIVGEKLTNKLKAEIIDLARNCDPSIYATVKQIDEVIVVEIKEGDEQPYQCSYGYYKRFDGVSQKMKALEIKKFFSDHRSKCFEKSPADNCTLDDISLEKVNYFVTQSKIDVVITEKNIEEFFKGLGLVENGKVNNAGALMFAKQTKKHVFHSETICLAFKDNERIHIYDRRDVRDDLIAQFNAAVDFFKKHLNVRSEIKGINREDIYEIPLSIIREAVANSLIHRNYSMTGTR